jgi:hypothetical protein
VLEVVFHEDDDEIITDMLVKNDTMNELHKDKNRLTSPVWPD